MCAGSPAFTAGPQRFSNCSSSSPLGVIMPCLSWRPFVPMGKAVRAYTSCISKSRIISRRVCLEMWGALPGIGATIFSSSRDRASPFGFDAPGAECESDVRNCGSSDWPYNRGATADESRKARRALPREKNMEHPNGLGTSIRDGAAGMPGKIRGKT